MNFIIILCIYFIFSWLFSEIKLFKLRHIKISDHFDFNDNENKKYFKLSNGIYEINKQLNLLKINLNRVNLLGKNLKRNRDNYFDERNSLGKKLNTELKNGFHSQSIGQVKLTELIQEKDFLEKVPKDKANNWIVIYSNCIAKRTVIIILFPIVLFLHYSEYNILFIVFIIWYALVYSIKTIIKKKLKKQIF